MNGTVHVASSPASTCGLAPAILSEHRAAWFDGLSADEVATARSPLQLHAQSVRVTLT